MLIKTHVRQMRIAARDYSIGLDLLVGKVYQDGTCMTNGSLEPFFHAIFLQAAATYRRTGDRAMARQAVAYAREHRIAAQGTRS